jgi:hypothetical protein
LPVCQCHAVFPLKNRRFGGLFFVTICFPLSCRMRIFANDCSFSAAVLRRKKAAEKNYYLHGFHTCIFRRVYTIIKYQLKTGQRKIKEW